MNYRLLVDIEAVAVIQSLPKAKRLQLLLRLEAIRDYPDRFVDYDERDSLGRRVAINIFHELAIHFWIDFADRHVKVMAIAPADKSPQ